MIFFFFGGEEGGLRTQRRVLPPPFCFTFWTCCAVRWQWEETFYVCKRRLCKPEDMYGELGIHQKESEKSSKEVNECMCGSMEGRWKKKKRRDKHTYECTTASRGVISQHRGNLLSSTSFLFYFVVPQRISAGYRPVFVACFTAASSLFFSFTSFVVSVLACFRSCLG